MEAFLDPQFKTLAHLSISTVTVDSKRNGELATTGSLEVDQSRESITDEVNKQPPSSLEEAPG